MKPFYLHEINEIVDGMVIKGSADLIITGATCYIERMKRPNTLLFMKNRCRLDWSILKKCMPCAVITDKEVESPAPVEGCSIIIVDNIDRAYWSFVEHYRALFDIPVVAVTGTSGKTTTKDMIKHILGQSLRVQGTEASANGRTGHLHYLLRLEDSTEAAVFETAVGRPGDITYACRHFRPCIGIITNIGIDHMDKCRNLDTYIRAKSEILTALGDEGILIINSDDRNSRKTGLEKFRGRIVYFGIYSSSHFHASDIRYTSGGMEFLLELQKIRYPVFVPGYGEHQVYNALAALAAAYELGIGIEEGAERLRSFPNMLSHLQLSGGIQGSLLLDDTWSMNITSLRAAFQALKGIAGMRKRVVLLGHINTQGDCTGEVVAQLRALVAEPGIDTIIAIGPMAYILAGWALKEGLKTEIYTFPDLNGVPDILKFILDENTILLAKCSMFDESFKEMLKALKQ